MEAALEKIIEYTIVFLMSIGFVCMLIFVFYTIMDSFSKNRRN